jgi:hypothetical protein
LAPYSQGIGKTIVAISSAVIGVIALVANLSQISDLILSLCKDYDVAAMEDLCKHVKSLAPERSATPSVDEKLPKFMRSQPNEQPQPRFKRSN